MIVWLASYPRSGNTMLRMALKHLYGIKTYSIYDDQDIVGMGAAEIVGHHIKRIDTEQLAHSAEVFYVKTHGPPNAPVSQFKAVHIVRDGRDTLTSYAHYRVRVDGLKKANGIPATPKESLDDLLSTSSHRWDGWSGHARKWLDWQGDCVVVKYEDIVADIHNVVGDALAQLGIPLRRIKDGNMPKFSQLKNEWPQFFRRGQSGSWSDFMTTKQLELFWSQHMDMMVELEYV